MIYGVVGIFYSQIVSFFKNLYEEVCWELKSFKERLIPGGSYEDLIHQLYFYDRYGWIGFQTPKSQNMSNLIATHNQIFGYCVFVVLFVFFFLVVTLVYYSVSNELKKGKYPYESVERKVERLSKIYEGIKLPKEELFFFDTYFVVVESEGTFTDKLPFRKDFIAFRIINKVTPKEETRYIFMKYFNRDLKIIKRKYKVKSKLQDKELLWARMVSHRRDIWLDTIRDHKRDQSSRSRRKFWDNLVVETVWTLVPSLILIAIALPSFFFLYSLSPDIFYDENTVFLKVIGHQWYWSYEFPSESFAILQKPVEASFSSYMLPTSELKEEMPRLLSVDNPVYLPTKTHIVIRVTSEDVIHSWAIPSLGVKLDCIPGRINEFVFEIDRAGTLYGQCSELCGVNHGFMPIHVVAYENV